MFTKNIVKYNANWEFTNIYENLQIVWSLFVMDKLVSFIFGLIWISIGLSVFRFIANKYKQRAIWLHLTIHNIWSPIWWVITKVILNYSPFICHKSHFGRTYGWTSFDDSTRRCCTLFVEVNTFYDLIGIFRLLATILIKIEKWLLDKAEHFSAKKLL